MKPLICLQYYLFKSVDEKTAEQILQACVIFNEVPSITWVDFMKIYHYDEKSGQFVLGLMVHKGYIDFKDGIYRNDPISSLFKKAEDFYYSQQDLPIIVF